MPTIDELAITLNIADMLPNSQVDMIGAQVVQDYHMDEESRKDWVTMHEEVLKLVKQVNEVKNFPWPNAANVKYPLATQAAIDYASRVMPELIQNNQIVKHVILGNDLDGKKAAKADRVSQYMSYQLLLESDNWVESMDRLLPILAVAGTVFKKVYYHPVTQKLITEVCTPETIVLNNHTDSLDRARRVTHVIYLYQNDIIERVRAKIFSDVDLALLTDITADNDSDSPIKILEQHCYLDLDEDGYKEPYIVTVHEESQQVLRIVSRFKEVKINRKDEVQYIEPEQYFIDFHFIKSPDGGFYSMGFGALLYPINNAVNTLTNQLIDAGTLSNSMSGFIGRGLRIKSGEVRATMGSLKVLDSATGQAIKDNIFLWPSKEPSTALFNLLGMLITAGKDLASINDTTQGKQSAQNVPAATILSLIEQGTKTFSAINKRLYRSLKREFRRIFELNAVYLNDRKYQNVLDIPNVQVESDFDMDSMDILPLADPSLSTAALRLVKAQALMQVPGVDQKAAAKYFLDAAQIDTEYKQALLPEPKPTDPPSIESQKAIAEIEYLKAQIAAIQTDLQLRAATNMLEIERVKIQDKDMQARVDESNARVIKMQQDAQNNANKIELATEKALHNALMDEIGASDSKDIKNKELNVKVMEVVGKNNAR